jgi:hypothetical protein
MIAEPLERGVAEDIENEGELTCECQLRTEANFPRKISMGFTRVSVNMGFWS